MMKKIKIPISQYAFETREDTGDVEEFTKKTAPLIGNIVFYFNSL